jgi:hypothetical protein
MLKSKKKTNPGLEDVILTIWKKEVCAKAEEVDPDSEYIWEGIFVGVVIALGGTAEYARELYNTKGFELERGDGL